MDLFAAKLPLSSLGDYFTEFEGGQDFDAACDFLLRKSVAFPV